MDLVPISQVAAELGKNKRHLFKVLDRLGIQKSLQKGAAARGQKVACITTDDFDKVKHYFS